LKAKKTKLEESKISDPLWNKVPSYGVEDLISSIEDPQELIQALQSEYRESNALKEKRYNKWDREGK